MLGAADGRKEGEKCPPGPLTTPVGQCLKSGFTCELTGKEAQGSRIWEAEVFPYSLGTNVLRSHCTSDIARVSHWPWTQEGKRSGSTYLT